MTARQPKGVPVGGQFAAEIRDEPDLALEADGLVIKDGPEHEIAWDAPEDRERYLAAAAFMAESDIEGTVSPLYTKYREDGGLDGVILQVDGRNMTVHHAGTMHPEVAYGDDEDDNWSFRMQAGDGAGKTEHEVLADVIERARHDAACQEAWRRDEETFKYGDEYSVHDFNVRFTRGGERIVSLSLDWQGRSCDLIQRGNADVQVSFDGNTDNPVPLPHIQLDAIALDFDEDHIEGTGDIRFKAMMRDAADRAEKEPGFHPRTVD